MKRGRKLLWGVFSGLVISGVGLYWCLPASIDDFPHPLNGVFRQWHGVFAFASLISIGQIWAEHIRKQINKWRRYPDGALHLLIWGGLIVSSYWLYYPPMALNEWLNIGQIHWWLGVALILMLPLHAAQRLAARVSNKATKASALS